MTKLKIIFTSVIVIAIVASVLLERRAQAKFHENEAVLRQQERQLTELEAENQRLSDIMAQAKTSRMSADYRTAELAQLRSKVEALQRQTNGLVQLAKQAAEKRRLAGARFYSMGGSNLWEHNDGIASAMGGTLRATGKLNDARAITAALRHYTSENQGQFPLSMDQVAPYLPKALDADSPPWADAPLTGTNDFEIVYQGSQDDLTNIPPSRVALIRERQPWLTPDGKWARTYGFANGSAEIIASDDNFQSWDAQHIIPPPSAGKR